VRLLACTWLLTSLCIISLPRLPSSAFVVVFICLTLWLGLCFSQCRPIVAGLLLSVLTLAFALHQLMSLQLKPEHVSTRLDITVRIVGVPERSDRRIAFTADVLSCESCNHALNVRTVRLSWYNRYENLNAGETWQLSVKLKPPSSLRNPGSFDAVAWHLMQGVQARGYVLDTPATTLLPDDGFLSLSAVRQNAATRLQRLSRSDEVLGLQQALTVGVKSNITDSQWEILRNSGTAHLIAISGLHIGLVAGWALFLGRLAERLVNRLWRRSQSAGMLDTRPFVLCLSLGCALTYAALAGFELPTQRAVLMLSVWLLAALRFRYMPPLAAWCIALIVVLVFNPLNLLSAGFWLSFGTVATLFYLHSGHQLLHPDSATLKWRGQLQKLRSAGRTHALLGIVLLPVSAWFFQSGSLIAPLANLIAVPWVALVTVPLSLLTLLISSFSEAAAMPLTSLVTWSLHCLMFYLDWLAQSALSSVVISLPGALELLLVLLGLLMIFAPRGLGLRINLVI